MKSLEKDDLIGRMMREEGLLKASPDLTARIMEQVEKTASRPVMEYQPLLSKRAWMLIAAAVLAIVGFSAWYVMPESSTATGISAYLKPASDFFSHLQLSFRIKPQLLMIGSLVFAATGLLLLLDYYLHNRFRQPVNI